MKNIIIFLVIINFITACNDDSNNHTKAEWIENAFNTISSESYTNIKAISWWHEDFDNSELTINSSEASLDAYRKGVSNSIFITKAMFSDNNKLLPPEDGIYHSAYPDFGGTEDIITTHRILNFEELAGKKIVWAYFSNNWYDKIEFPKDAVITIHEAGKVPFIRMMPRSNFDEGGPDPIYTMQKIIDGDFDSDLVIWADQAKNLQYPLLVEFGTEVNGNWFPWNGQYNGGGTADEYGDTSYPDGAERFRDAYRHIIDIFNDHGVKNITWFFHVDAYSEPETEWNKIKYYYPGDEYIDWLGVSIYGPQERGEEYQEFSEIISDVYPQLLELSPEKPIAILEFAVTELH